MVNCNKCGEELGVFKSKFKHIDKDGNEYVLCSNCNEEYEKEELNKNAHKEDIRNKKALEINNKWEYKIVNLKKLNHEFDLEKNLKEDVLNDYGSKGWELINVITPTQNDKLAHQLIIVPMALVFKRRYN